MKKIKYADGGQWSRVKKKSHNICRIQNGLENFKEFDGYISLIDIAEVNEPLVKVMPDSTELRIVDDNYKWLRLMPINEYFCITVSINDKNEIVQWYFDIVSNVGVNNNKVFFVDLFLDFVILPNGKFYILDGDELITAYIHEEITHDEVLLAYKTLMKKVIPFKDNIPKLIDITNECLAILEKNE